MTEHPDLLLQQNQVKQVKTGGTQSADTAAMEAYWKALEEGKSKEQAAVIFFNTYLKVKDGK
jgi:hypothetical protein